MEEKVDVIIVGTGAAGLFCALHLPKTCKVLMVTKDIVEHSDSYLAQGGISTLLNEEDYESYYEDTMKAGHYENREESVEIMIRSSRDIINQLIELGVEFDKENNELSYTREGAHSTFRILHHKDITGKEITSKLYERVKERDNITICEHTTMVDIIEDEDGCQGVVVKDEEGYHVIRSLCTVWATGGIGGLFESSTNYRHLTGDSLSIALRHKIALENVNYIQIHPTTLYSTKPGRRFLISESVRGEGAILLNPDGERFVDELLPRDAVTEAICEQLEKYHSNYVYLSVKHLGEEEVKKRFPNIYERCLEEGIDMVTDLIPVTPAQHYFMGGVYVDSNSKTTMDHLYAVGETSCNGVHGANRLASNSLLEGLVFAQRAAGQIKEEIKNRQVKDMELSIDFSKYDQFAKENKMLVLDEIKRRDGEFYAKWCNYEN